jgi:thymidylate synthase (FAD)
MINVLDKGYVRLVDHMGSDLSVVNAARVSFAKESTELDDKDEKLIAFLIREDHLSPFRHAFVTIEVKAPLLVARQWWKYCIGSTHQDIMQSWNEASRRYVTMEPEFYIPNEWRSAPDNKKQGSGGPIDPTDALYMTRRFDHAIIEGLGLYNQALKEGVCAEQARLFLPAYAMYTAWRWSASLQGVIHFLSQRLADDAQVEIQEYAKAVKTLIEPLFPMTFKAFETIK